MGMVKPLLLVILFTLLIPPSSVGDFVRLGLPLDEGGQRLFTEKLAGGQFPLVEGQGNLTIKKLIVEPGSGGVLPGGGEEKSIDASPVDGAQAHRAWLATGVKLAAIEPKRGQFPAGLADGHDFCMGGGIVGGGHRVPSPADNPTILDDECPERPSPAFPHFFDREADGFVHEGVVHSDYGK